MDIGGRHTVGAHLTIRLGHDVHGDHVEDHSNERGDTRKGIDLPKRQISPKLTGRMMAPAPLPPPPNRL